MESSLTFSLKSCGQQPKFNGMSKGLSGSKAEKIVACCLKRQLSYDIQSARQFEKCTFPCPKVSEFWHFNLSTPDDSFDYQLLLLSRHAADKTRQNESYILINVDSAVKSNTRIPHFI